MLTESLIQATLENNLTVHIPLNPSRRDGTVTIKLKKSLKAYQRFQQEKIFIDIRPVFGLRFSPHIYNDEKELQQVTALMKLCD